MTPLTAALLVGRVWWATFLGFELEAWTLDEDDDLGQLRVAFDRAREFAAGEVEGATDEERVVETITR